ncbi:hypothetical protein Lfu02_14180 [Longispora fulva]|nr:hypothetical protein Lfu02_14180 [Longispora fulva]
MGDVLEFLVEIPEGDEEKLYTLADHYAKVAEHYYQHIDELAPLLNDISMWGGDGAAMAAYEQLNAHIEELGTNGETAGNMSEAVQTNALSIETTKWMALASIAMLAMGLYTLIAAAFVSFGGSLSGAPALVFAARQAIKTAAEELLNTLRQQGLKALLKKIAEKIAETVGTKLVNPLTNAARNAAANTVRKLTTKEGLKLLGKDLGLTALRQGKGFVSFTLKQELAIKAIETLEGHDPKWSMEELGKLAFSSFLTGALGAPFALGGKRGLFREAGAMGLGQAGSNLVTMGIDAGLTKWKGEKWAAEHGFGTKSMWDGVGQAALFGGVMGGMGSMEGKLGGGHAVDPAASHLNEPAAGHLSDPAARHLNDPAGHGLDSAGRDTAGREAGAHRGVEAPGLVQDGARPGEQGGSRGSERGGAQQERGTSDRQTSSRTDRKGNESKETTPVAEHPTGERPVEHATHETGEPAHTGTEREQTGHEPATSQHEPAARHEPTTSHEQQGPGDGPPNRRVEQAPPVEHTAPAERPPVEHSPTTEHNPPAERTPVAEHGPAAEHTTPGERATGPEHTTPGERAPGSEHTPPAEHSPVEHPTGREGGPEHHASEPGGSRTERSETPAEHREPVIPEQVAPVGERPSAERPAEPQSRAAERQQRLGEKRNEETEPVEHPVIEPDSLSHSPTRVEPETGHREVAPDNVRKGLEAAPEKPSPSAERVRSTLDEHFGEPPGPEGPRGMRPEEIGGKLDGLREGVREERVTASELEGFQGHDAEAPRVREIKSSLNDVVDSLKEHQRHESWSFESFKNGNLTVSIHGKGPEGEHFTKKVVFEIRVGEVAEGAVAETGQPRDNAKTGRTHFDVKVSDRIGVTGDALQRVVGRAVSHEISENLHKEFGVNHPFGEGGGDGLSSHQHGRLAEERYLLSERAHADPAVESGRVSDINRELDQLHSHMLDEQGRAPHDPVHTDPVPGHHDVSGLPPEHQASAHHALNETNTPLEQHGERASRLDVTDPEHVRVGHDGLVSHVKVGDTWKPVGEHVSDVAKDHSSQYRELKNAGHPDFLEKPVGPCVSVAVDTRTGHVIEGTNKLGVPESELHPKLQERINELNAEKNKPENAEKWKDQNLFLNEPGSHAEIQAVNKLLWLRELEGIPITEHTFKELVVDNRSPWQKASEFPEGVAKDGEVPMACCAHCSHIISDVPSRTGQFTQPVKPGEFGVREVRLPNGEVVHIDYRSEYGNHPFEPGDTGGGHEPTHRSEPTHDINATEVEHTTFRAEGREPGRADLSHQEIADAVRSLHTEDLGHRVADLEVTVDAHGEVRVEMRLSDGRAVDVSVRIVDELPRADQVAHTEIRGDHATVELNRRIAPEHVARALGHELAEVSHTEQPSRLSRRLDPEGQHAPSDALRRGPANEAVRDGRLSPHDHGRLAELRILAREHAELPPGERARVEREISGLVDHLGLSDAPSEHWRGLADGVEARRELLPEDVRRVLDDLPGVHDRAATHPNGEPRLAFDTHGTPRAEAMPEHPNEEFVRLRERCDEIAAEQRAMAESLIDREPPGPPRVDGKYWFARVYEHVTTHESRMIDEGRYEYPIMKMQEVEAFHQTYKMNLEAWRDGRFGEVEPNWHRAFGIAERAETIPHGLQSFEVLHELLPAMHAHIRFDLARAIAAVYHENYAGKVPLETFREDFDRMQPVFDQASLDLLPEIRSRTMVIDPGRYEIMQQIGMKGIFNVPAERARTWEKAEEIAVAYGEGVTDPVAIQRRLENYRDANHLFTGRNDFKLFGKEVTDYDWGHQPRAGSELAGHDRPPTGGDYITSNEMPGYSGHGGPYHPAEVRGAIEHVAGRLGGEHGAHGFRSVEFHPDAYQPHRGTLIVEPHKGAPRVFEVTIDRVPDGTMATTHPPLERGGPHRITVSAEIPATGRELEHIVGRAVSHEIAETMRESRGPVSRLLDVVRRGSVGDALSPDADPAARRLSAHDHGHLAELRFLSEERMRAPLGEHGPIDARLRHLMNDMGLSGHGREVEHRLAIVDRHLTPEARATLDRLRTDAGWQHQPPWHQQNSWGGAHTPPAHEPNGWHGQERFGPDGFGPERGAERFGPDRFGPDRGPGRFGSEGFGHERGPGRFGAEHGSGRFGAEHKSGRFGSEMSEHLGREHGDPHSDRVALDHEPSGHQAPVHEPVREPSWATEEHRPRLSDMVPRTEREAGAWKPAVERAIAKELEDRDFAGLRVKFREADVHSSRVTVYMDVFHPDRAEPVGSITRELIRDGNVVEAQHVTLKLDANVRGAGFARAFNDHLENWYVESGVERISLRAAMNVGGYAWAREGYTWDPRFGDQNARTCLSRLGKERNAVQADLEGLVSGLGAGDTAGVERIVARHGGEDPAAVVAKLRSQVRAADELIARSRATSFGSKDFPTPYEISQCGRAGEHGVDATWVGKKAMLGADWRGVKTPEPRPEAPRITEVEAAPHDVESRRADDVRPTVPEQRGPPADHRLPTDPVRDGHTSAPRDETHAASSGRDETHASVGRDEARPTGTDTPAPEHPDPEHPDPEHPGPERPGPEHPGSDHDAGGPHGEPRPTDGGPDLRHSALGHELGGAYLHDADPARTASAIESILGDRELLPPDMAVSPSGHEAWVARPDGGAYPVRFETVPVHPGHAVMVDAHSYHPTTAVRYHADHAVLYVSENASPDHIRQGVSGTLTEIDVQVKRQLSGERLDTTSKLVENSRLDPAVEHRLAEERAGTSSSTHTPDRVELTPKDAGRVATMRTLAHDLARAESSGDVARAQQLRADAVGRAIAYGLGERNGEPVHRLGDNQPASPKEAADWRRETLKSELGAEHARVADILDTDAGHRWADSIQELRTEDRQALRTGVERMIEDRNAADAVITRQVAEALDAGTPHVFDRLILGNGWAATLDFVHHGPTGGGELPRVMSIGDHAEPWLPRGDLKLGQVPGELELPGMPFQPGHFAEPGTDFLRADHFGLAVGAARAMSDMPTYHGNAQSVVARPEGHAPGWPDGAQYRVTVDGRTMYTAAVDVTTGPGQPRVVSYAENHVPPRIIDPGSGFSVEEYTSKPKFFDRDQQSVPFEQVPKEALTQFDLNDNGAAGRTGPLVADRQGRLTDPRIIDVPSGVTVDGNTHQVYDRDGHLIDRGSVDPDVLDRLGFRPDGTFVDPRLVVHPSGTAMHPVTGEVLRVEVDPATGRVLRITETGVDQARVHPDVLRELTNEASTRQVQFGGQNLASDYRPGERVVVYGAGASGAWDVEQAARASAMHGDAVPDPGKSSWIARPNENAGDLHDVRQQFENSGGYNRRNTLPGLGAFSEHASQYVERQLGTLTSVMATTDGKFRITFEEGLPEVYDRVVFSIGQEPTYPGGPADLVRGHDLHPLYGPGGEVNGLHDASGGLRVLGAASTPNPVTGNVVPALRDVVRGLVGDQAGALPHDSQNIPPSIRHTAGRIVQANMPFDGFVPKSVADPFGRLAPEQLHAAEGLAAAEGATVRGLPELRDASGLGLVRLGPSDPGTVTMLRELPKGDLAGQVSAVGRAYTKAVEAEVGAIVFDGRQAGLTAAQAWAVMHQLPGGAHSDATVKFILRDGTVVAGSDLMPDGR